jgi:anthranilate synthase/aminodeoxychorismate synthase-like glutamine amidotransferase
VTRILVVDNYDSFVYNLVQYVGRFGADPEVHRNDAIDVEAAMALEPAGVIVSPGPGRPEDAGLSCDLIAACAGRIPVLGVCLGHQCIAQVFGGRIVRSAVVHGKTSEIVHDGAGIFDGVASPLTATRYHSLVVDPDSVPETLTVTARAEDGTIMGLRHRTGSVEGVQFHPESILTPDGLRIVANWLAACGHRPSQAGAAALLPG